MQGWEYLVVAPNWPFDGTGSLIGGADLRLASKQMEDMNRLGDLGWELVAVDQQGRYVFKRPKG